MVIIIIRILIWLWLHIKTKHIQVIMMQQSVIYKVFIIQIMDNLLLRIL